MAVRNPEIPAGGVVQTPEEDRGWDYNGVSLREYLLIFLSWWREIGLIMLLGVVVSVSIMLLLRALIPPTFESVSTVAIIRSRSDINFDERFRTLSEDDLTLLTMNSSARRAALVGLVQDGAIAEVVIDQMGDKLNRQESQPALLLRRIQATLASGNSVRGESDLIQISARSDTAEKAAEIANIWAREYVRRVNSLYSATPQGQLDLVREELVQAEAEFDAAQTELEEFIAGNEIDRLTRLVSEKQEIINRLQTGRNTAITTFVDEELGAQSKIIAAYLNAQAENRLLAFEEVQKAQREFLQKLIQADSESRLLALEKEREVRSEFFNQYVDADINNRLTAFQTEQITRGKLFSATVEADMQGRLAVIDEQAKARVDELAQAYESQAKMRRLSDDATGLRAQIEQAGPSGETSNSFAILLLKSQVFASSDELPTTVTFNLAETVQGNESAEAQLADVQALTDVLDARIAELDARILTLSEELAGSEGYYLVDTSPDTDSNLFNAIKRRYFELFELGDLAASGNAVADSTALSTAVLERYSELFDVGALISIATELSDSSPLLTTIQEEFPELFEVGAIAGLGGDLASGSGLDLLTVERARELLQLSGLESVPEFTSASAPLAEAMDTLEKEIQSLKAQREADEARLDQLTRKRDLLVGTLTTLLNKQEELSLATTVATNSEVQLALPAVQPAGPETTIRLSVGVTLGLLLGGIVGFGWALIAHLLGRSPFLASRGTAAA